MKKLISILMIAALAGFMAVGCSTPEAEAGKTGDAAATTTGGAKTEEGKPVPGAPGLTGEATKEAADATKGAADATKDAAGKMGDAADKMGDAAGKMGDAAKGDAPKTEEKK